MKTYNNKYIVILILIILYIPIIFLQKGFNKTNPYDPNWVYGDNDISISKTIYSLTSEKNFYATMKLSAWRIRVAESTKGNQDKFLAKKETLQFVDDFLSLKKGFTALPESISNIVLFNTSVSDSVKEEYANKLYSVLSDSDSVNEENTLEGKRFVQFFEKEYNICKSDRPLSKKLWKIYWGVGVYERLVTKDDKKAFCNFLFAGYGTDLSGWYENMISTSKGYSDVLGNNYVDDFGLRLKQYYYHVNNDKYSAVSTNSGIMLNDNQEFYNRIVNINNMVLQENNNKVIIKLLGK